MRSSGRPRPRGRGLAALALVLAVAAGSPPPLAAQVSAGAATPPTTAPPEPAPPALLSLDEAVALAFSNNPTVRATRNDRTLADWDVRSAYGSLLPSLNATGGVSWQGAGEQRFGSVTLGQLGFGGQPSYYFSSYNLGLSYQLDGRTLLEPRRARFARAATEERIRASEVDVTALVTRAYLEVLRQEDQVALARAQLERAGFALRLARGRQEVGTATPLDVMQAEVQLGRAEVTLLQAENAVRTARLRLLQQMGVRLDREITLTTDFPLVEPRWEAGTLYALALERNPSLAAASRTRAAADEQVRIARSAYYPSLSLSAGISGFTREASSVDFMVAQARGQVVQQVQQCAALNDLYARLADPLPAEDCSRYIFTDEQHRSIVQSNDRFPFDFTRQPPSLSVGLSLPIFQGLTRQRQLEAARLDRVDAEEQIRQQRLALEADLAIGLATVETAHRSAELEARNQQVADEQLRLAQERYRVGSAAFQELVEAETVKVQADRDYLTAVFAYHDAVTDLEALVGVPLREP